MTAVFLFNNKIKNMRTVRREIALNPKNPCTFKFSHYNIARQAENSRFKKGIRSVADYIRI
jgi:hypothetical protein